MATEPKKLINEMAAMNGIVLINFRIKQPAQTSILLNRDFVKKKFGSDRKSTAV
jgi:hypothetical protein